MQLLLLSEAVPCRTNTSFGPGNNIPILQHYGTLNKKSSSSAGLISSVQDCIPVITVFHVIGLSSIMCWSLYCKHKQSITRLLFIYEVQSTKFKEISFQVQLYFWIFNCWKYFHLRFYCLDVFQWDVRVCHGLSPVLLSAPTWAMLLLILHLCKCSAGPQ